MIQELGDLLGQTQESMLVGFVVFLRVGAAMAILPAFGERSVPERVRLILALCFTAIVAPAVHPGILGKLGADRAIGLLIATEAATGLMIGFALRLFVMALQVAGSIAAQSTSLSQIFGSAGADPQPAIGHLMVISGLAIAVTTGLHVRVAELFIYSYSITSPGEFLSANLASGWAISRVSVAFGLAFSLAAPFVIASLIYNIALGVINRAMPQLMVAFVGAPAITAGGLFLLFASLPILLSVWQSSLLGFFAHPFGSIP